MSLSSGVLTANGSKNDHKWKRPPAIKVVGIYEDLWAGLLISRLCAQSSEDFGRRVRFEVNLYSFDVLTLPAGDSAVERAQEADALIVAAHSTKVLPLRIREWLERAQAGNVATCMEFLDHHEDSPAHRRLYQLAERAACVWNPESDHEEAALAIECISVSALDDEDERCDSAHYGIND